MTRLNALVCFIVVIIIGLLLALTWASRNDWKKIDAPQGKFDRIYYNPSIDRWRVYSQMRAWEPARDIIINLEMAQLGSLPAIYSEGGGAIGVWSRAGELSLYTDSGKPLMRHTKIAADHDWVQVAGTQAVFSFDRHGAIYKKTLPEGADEPIGKLGGKVAQSTFHEGVCYFIEDNGKLFLIDNKGVSDVTEMEAARRGSIANRLKSYYLSRIMAVGVGGYRIERRPKSDNRIYIKDSHGNTTYVETILPIKQSAGLLNEQGREIIVALDAAGDLHAWQSPR